MTKVNRKILLSIVTFLAVLCFSMAFILGFSNTAKADNTLSIKSIKQTYAQPYNSTHPDGTKYQYTSLYTIDFDQEISELSNYSVGEEVTALFENFTAKTKFGANGKSLSEMSHMSAKLFKIDADSVELSVYRPVFCTQIVFAEGITVGNFELTPSNWYEQSDWTFTTEAPTELKIMAVYEKNLASEVNATYVNLRFAFNMKGHIVNASALKGITINGESIYTSETVSATTVNTNVAVAGSNGVYHGNDWDSPGYQDAYIRVPKTALANGATITFPAGFTLDKNSLKTAQTFSIGVADRTVMTEQPVWAEVGEDVGGGDEEEPPVNEDAISITEIKQTYVNPYNQTDNRYRSNYDITFDANIYGENTFTDGQDITEWVKANTNVMEKVKFNGNTLADIDAAGETLKFFYAGETVLELETGRPCWWAKIEIASGCIINNLEVNAITYYEEQDWSFTTTAPTELRVVAIAERPYAGDGGLWNLVSVTFNGSLAGTSSDFNKISFESSSYTGSALYNTQAHIGGGGGSIATEKTNGGTVHNLYFLKSELGGTDGVYTEITFAEGYRGIAEKQIFCVEAGISHSNWAAMPMWTEIEETAIEPNPGGGDVGGDVEEPTEKIAITSITQTYAQPYNGAHPNGSKYAYTSHYVIEFNKTIFNGVAVGTDVTAQCPKFLDNTLYGVLEGTLQSKMSALNNNIFLYKYSNTALELSIYRPVMWTQFKFTSGIVIDGNALTPSNWYEQSDWTFTTEEPTELKIMAVYEKNLASEASANYINLRFAYNMKGTVNYNTFNGVLINGENVYVGGVVSGATVNTNVAIGDASGVYYGNDWDSPGQQDAYIRIPKSVVEKGATITFPVGFTIGGYSLTKAQTFKVGIDSSYVNTEPTDQRVWVETDKVIKAKGMEIVSQMGASTSKYSLEFDSTEDVLANLAIGADAKTYLDLYTNVTWKIKLNGNRLFDLSNVSIKKTATNVLEISIAEALMFANFEILAGLRIEGLMTTDDVTYQLSSIEADTNVTVLDITAETNYGMMGDDTAVRFSLRFADLGIFGEMDLGTDITSYLAHSAFMDNVLINGVSLSAMKADGRPISMYRGSKDKEIYQGNDYYFGYPYGTAIKGKYDVSNAIEIYIGSLQLYDYTVTVNKGCILGDLFVNETVNYQKQLDESFELMASTSIGVKPITIREIPYGAQANTRAIVFVFNDAMSFTSDPNFINAIRFNGQAITNAEESFITIKGGCYVNGEVRYGRRQYTVLVDATEYAAFMLGENPTIEIPEVELADGSKTTAVKFVLEKGTWVPEGTDLTDYEAPAFVDVFQHGNQGIDSYNPNNNSVNSKYGIEDYKLVRFITNYGYNHYLATPTIRDTLYVNGLKATDYPYHSSGIEAETKWEGICYSFWLSNDVRNYDTGIDVFYIPRGVIISGNRIIDHDTYIYSVRSNTLRDGAGNWAWEFFFEKPALEVYKGGQVVVGDETITATVEFDRVTGKNDVKFGIYNEVSAASNLKINGKLLSEYTGENAFVWTDNGFTVNLKKSELGNYEDEGLNFVFLDDFVTPLGYAFDGEATYAYSFVNQVWNKDFEKANVSLPNNSPASLSTISQIRVGDKEVEGAIVPKLGYKFSVNFSNAVAGVIKLEGANMPAHTLFRNVTAPYSDLVKLTELGYAGNIIGVGYEYLDYVIEKFISYGIRDSILDNIVINGDTVREILARETAYDSLKNYPFQITLNGNKLEFIIQEDSVLYSSVKEGFVLSINKNVVFEADCRTLVNSSYKLVNVDGALAFEEHVFNSDITVTNTKSTYYQGDDLDLTKIIAYYIMSNDERGERITITMDMISGYDKNVLGEQTVTVTVNGLSDTFKVNVVENFQHQDIVTEKPESGCGSAFGGNVIVLVAALASCAALILLKKVRKD